MSPSFHRVSSGRVEASLRPARRIEIPETGVQPARPDFKRIGAGQLSVAIYRQEDVETGEIENFRRTLEQRGEGVERLRIVAGHGDDGGDDGTANVLRVALVEQWTELWVKAGPDTRAVPSLIKAGNW